MGESLHGGGDKVELELKAEGVLSPFGRRVADLVFS